MNVSPKKVWFDADMGISKSMTQPMSKMVCPRAGGHISLLNM